MCHLQVILFPLFPCLAIMVIFYQHISSQMIIGFLIYIMNLFSGFLLIFLPIFLTLFFLVSSVFLPFITLMNHTLFMVNSGKYVFLIFCRKHNHVMSVS